MNLDEMLKALKAEATESGEAILAEARAQAKEILGEAKAQGEKLAAQSFEEAQQKLRFEKAKVLSAANFDVKKEVLQAKEEVLTQLFAKLTEQVSDVSSNENVIKKLADEALVKFKGQKVKVLVGKGQKNIVEKVLSGSAGAYEVDDSLGSIGGLKIISEDGRISIDNTIEGRIEKIKQIYETEITKDLFGGEN